MAKAARNPNSTQKFIGIKDVVEDIVILSNGTACVIVEVTAANFELLSPEEQDARIYAYATLLNSLSFSIQILIRSKRVDISNYLSSLDNQIAATQNPQLRTNVQKYKEFIKNLVKVNVILDKQFYIVIPYSSLEKGASGVSSAMGRTQKDLFLVGAKSSLYAKSENLLSQLQRTGLKASRIDKDKIIKLFYDIFNSQLASQINAQKRAENTTGEGGKNV